MSSLTRRTPSSPRRADSRPNRAPARHPGRRALRSLALLALTTGLLSPTYAVADDPVTPSSPVTPSGPAGPPADPTALALETLGTAEALLTGKGATAAPAEPEQDVSLALAEVRQVFEHLPARDKARAQRLLQRPTAPGPGEEVGYPPGADRAHCVEHACVHWIDSAPHNPSLVDGDSDGVPDHVETVAEVTEEVWTHEVGELGFREPMSDGLRGNPVEEQRSGLVDVYLGETGSNGIYGYASTDDFRARSSGYLVIDNDFAEFGGDPGELMRATLAHEFLHLSQFAYDTTEDLWLLETTATWVEEQVYDDINDNRQYLPMSSLRHPDLPIDGSPTWYGNWAFFEHVSLIHGPGIVPEIWHAARSQRVSSIRAIEAALLPHGSNLGDAISRFAGSSNIPRDFYPEGWAWPTARTRGAWTLSASRTTPGIIRTRIPQLGSHDYSFAPSSRFSSAWRAVINIDAPANNTRAYLILHLTDGSKRRRPIRLDSNGNAILTTGFYPSRLRKFSLSLSNTSLRFRCDQDQLRACSGIPLADDRLFRFRVTAFRS